MPALQLLPPIRIRLHEDDHAKYGGDWYVYDEEALVRLPVGELRDIERAIGMSVPEMLNRSRGMYADATLAQMWIARRMAGITEPFDQFTPVVFLADWEVVDQAKGPDADPPDLGSSPPPAARKRSSRGTSRSSPTSSTRRRAS